MPGVLATVLSNPSKPKVQSPHQHFFHVFLASHVVLLCQNQDALRKCALRARNFSELGGFKPPLSPRIVFRQPAFCFRRSTLASSHVPNCRPDHGRASASDGHGCDPQGVHPEVGQVDKRKSIEKTTALARVRLFGTASLEGLR